MQKISKKQKRKKEERKDFKISWRGKEKGTEKRKNTGAQA